MLPAGKGQEPPNQDPRAFRCLECAAGQASKTFIRPVPGLQQLQGSVDWREEVVEVMRYAAGELADGFHLLHLSKLNLKFLALGNVTRSGDNETFAIASFPRDKHEHDVDGPGAPGHRPPGN